MELCRVHPGLREKVVLLWEFFLKALEVHSKGALSADIVHAEIVVDTLGGG